MFSQANAPRFRQKAFLCAFQLSATAKQELKILRRSSRVLVPPAYAMDTGLVYLDFSGDFDWRAWGNTPPTLRWWMNGFKYLRPLLAASGRRLEDIELAKKILKGWVDANPPEQPASDFAWDGQATAFRAELLAALYVLSTPDDWLLRTMERHAQKLAEPGFHQGNWNHGLDQDIGLFALGQALNREDWCRIAFERAAQNFDTSVDSEGVAHEQAVGYQYYVFLRFSEFLKLLKSSGWTFDANRFARLSLMCEFAAHSVCPDGYWAQLGDTLFVKAGTDVVDLSKRSISAFSRGTALEFAITEGERGKKPTSRFAIYDAGFAFGRTGWGERRPFRRESYYTLRFGSGRAIHGHNDHTSVTYHYRGCRTIIDGGFHGYTASEMRRHLQRPEAHNVVVSSGNERFLWHELTRLTHHEIAEDWQSYVLQDNPYRGTTRTRSLLFCQEPEFIIILDKVVSDRKRSFEQLWHFDRDVSLRSLHRSRATLSTACGAKVALHQLWPHDGIVFFQGERVPCRGWSGYRTGELVAVPCLATHRTGKLVTYLTVITFCSPQDEVVVYDKATNKVKGVRRYVHVRIANESRYIFIPVQGQDLRLGHSLQQPN